MNESFEGGRQIAMAYFAVENRYEHMQHYFEAVSKR